METRNNRKRKVSPSIRSCDQPESSARKKEEKKPVPASGVPLPGAASPTGRRSQKRTRRSASSSRKRPSRFVKTSQEETADPRRTRMEGRSPPRSESDDELGLDEDQRRNMQSASTALQGLLRKLGAGLDGILPEQTASNAQLKEILMSLRAEGDEVAQVNALSELCGILSMGTEDTLGGLSIEVFVPALVKCLNVEHNPDMMLLAARAIAHLADAIPLSCAAMVHHGAVNALCDRLLNIEYIDLAEQSLYALEKISNEAPTSCVRTGALMAVLSYLDFFPLGIQRVALSAAANMCRQLPADCWQFVQGSIPIMTNLLRYHDMKIVEHACTCLCRIAEQIASKGITSVDVLCSLGLVEEAAKLVKSATATEGDDSSIVSLSPATFVGLIKLMSICVAGSPNLAVTLHKLEFSCTLKEILSGSCLLSGTPKSPSTGLRSASQVTDVLVLAENLLPELPEASITALHLVPKALHSVDSHGEPQEGLKNLLESEPVYLYEFGCNLLPTLMQLHSSTMNSNVRHKCLVIMCKVVHFCSPEQLENMLKDIPFSSFLASLLSSGDPIACHFSLAICDTLMEKCPTLFARAFLREGVVHAVDVLASSPIEEAAEKEARKTRDRRWSLVVSPHTPGNSGSISKAAIAKSAACFKSSRFPAISGKVDSNMDVHGLEGLAHLRQIASGIMPDKAGKDYSHAALAFKDLQELLHGSSDSSKFSRFELASSGIIQSLKNFLHEEDGDDIDLKALMVARDALLNTASPVFGELVRHLNEVLSSTERFQCLLLSHNDHSGRSVSENGVLSILAHPLKLKLVRHPAEKHLREYGDNVVLIEPLATMSAIEDFLLPRVSARQGESSTQAGSCQQESGDQGMCDNLLPQPNQAEALEKAERKGKELAATSDGGGAEESQIQTRSMSSLKGKEKSGDAQGKAGTTGTASEVEEGKDDERESEQVDDGEDDMMEEGDIMSEEEDYIAEIEEMADGLDHPGAQDDSEMVNEVHNLELEDNKQPEESSQLASSKDGLMNMARSRANKEDTSTEEEQKKCSLPETPQKPMLSFEVGGHATEPGSTIFRAIRQSCQLGEEESVALVEKDSEGFMDETFTVMYKSRHTCIEGDAASASVHTHNKHTVSSNSLEMERFTSLHISNDSFVNDVLDLIRMLEYLNRFTLRRADNPQQYAHAPPEVFVNNKLTSKLKRQLQDVLVVCSGGLPKWCEILVKKSPFLFSFESRLQYFYRSCLGLGRALHHLQQQQDIEGRSGQANGAANDFRIGRLQRQKVRISRTRILDSAAKVFEMYAGHKAVLEVEYFGEVGTGLGPTLEFYTLVSQELQKKSLNLWRSEHGLHYHTDHKESKFVSAPYGLFPRPLSLEDFESEKGKKILERFKLCGRLVGKAIHDNRLIDLPISPVFFSLLLRRPVGIAELCRIDPSLGRQLQEIQKALTNCSLDTPAVVFGSRLQDLELDYSLPGYPEYNLLADGGTCHVTDKNAEEWLDAVLDASLGEGVARQVENFRAGFSEVLSIDSLCIFSEEEIESLLCGTVEEWSPEYLAECIKFDHGYTSASSPVKYLLQVLSEFSEEDRRGFLRFVTGSPRLPAGGLMALQPRLTVVRKHAADDASAKDLPSVMTCANYLKLPVYESIDVLRERLMYALHEGQGSFDLS